jgi:FAD/FMN-containing dehydrogenase
MIVKGRTTGDVELDQKTLDELRTRLRGALVLSGDPDYDEARSVWNAMIDRRPALTARCLGVADVVTCVNFAREHDLLLSIKGGGHNIAGLAVSDGGLMLDMSLMRGVWVDPAARIAHAQAGCLLGDVDRETQLHGLAAVLGFVSNTGIAGLTLGGGFGYLTRRFGWTCDNVVSMDVVTAEGRLVRASEKEERDLFWGLRGGGGNFGVATNFEYKLYPLGPEVVAGAIAWPGENARDVLAMYRTLAEEAPPELTWVAVLRKAPPAPWLSKDIHGKSIIALFVCHTGPVAEGEKQVAPIKAFGSPVGDVIQRRSYVSQQALLDGALNRLPEDHCPAGNRETASVLNITGSWERAEDDQANIEWARAAWQDMRRFSTGGTYINFLTEDEGDERTHAAYGTNYERLIGVKTKWDPRNLFRTNKNIAPRKP